MSHTDVIDSPVGTSLLDRGVGELVAERPGRSRIFQRAGIDFCCQGKKTVAEACQAKGIAPHTVEEQLLAELEEHPSQLEYPAELPLDELIKYIVDTHHRYVRQELPRLHAMAERVAQVHGGHTPSLVELLGVFCGMAHELIHHLMKEEQVLFPAIEAMSDTGAPPMPLDLPIEHMVEEHDEANAALTRLREITNGYMPPEDACNTYRALFAGLREFDEDMQKHIHLENNVLFPAAEAMAASAQP